MMTSLGRLIGLIGIALVVVVAMTAEVRAQTCTFTISTMDFGTVNTSQNTVFDTTASLGIRCRRGPANGTARVCPSIGSGTGGTSSGNPRTLLSGANAMNFNIYSDATRTTVWGSHFWPWSSLTPPTLDIPLDNRGRATTTRTLYGRVWASQTLLPSGTYQSAFSGGHTLVAYAFSTATSCAGIGSTNGAQVPFTARATNNVTCTVSATTLDFGPQVSLASMIDQQGSVTVTCSNGTPYNVGLDGGLAGATNPTLRKMSLGTTQITYGIYRNALRTQPWGNTIGTNTQPGTGTGSAQVLPVYGRVPVQATPPAGTYSDTVVVTITY